MPVEKKPRSHKKPAATMKHPAYEVMIKGALEAALKDRRGMSRQKVIKHVKANYKVGTNADVHVRLALKRLVTAKKIVQTKGVGACGSFKLVKSAPSADSKQKPKAIAPKAAAAPAKKTSAAVSSKNESSTKKAATKKQTIKKIKGASASAESKKAAVAGRKSPKKAAKKPADKKAAVRKKSPAKKTAVKSKKLAAKQQAKKPLAKKPVKK